MEIDLSDQVLAHMGDDSAVLSGKMSVGDAITILRQRLDGRRDIKECAKTPTRHEPSVSSAVSSWISSPGSTGAEGTAPKLSSLG